MSEKSDQRYVERKAAIDWLAVAKALGVSLDTLPVVSSASRREPERANVVKPPCPADGYRLSDEEWRIIKPHIPKGVVSRAKNDRGFIDGVIWRERMKGTGKSWWYVPTECGTPTASMRGRFARWAEWGWWEELTAKLEAEPLSEQRKRDFRGIAREAVQRRQKVLAARCE